MLCSRNFNRHMQISCIKFNPKGDLMGKNALIRFFLFTKNFFQSDWFPKWTNANYRLNKFG